MVLFISPETILIEVWEPPVHLNIISDRSAGAGAEAKLWLAETWQLSRQRSIDPECICRDRTHMLELRKTFFQTPPLHSDPTLPTFRWIRNHSLTSTRKLSLSVPVDCECIIQCIQKIAKHCNEIPLHTFHFHAMPSDLFAILLFTCPAAGICCSRAMSFLVSVDFHPISN